MNGAPAVSALFHVWATRPSISDRKVVVGFSELRCSDGWKSGNEVENSAIGSVALGKLSHRV